ncbi:MAG: hypothetical protein WA971_01580, partial [Microbacterium sp.]
MTPKKSKKNADQGGDDTLGVLEDVSSIDTTSLGFAAPTEQVSVALPAVRDDDDDLDESLVGDELTTDLVIDPDDDQIGRVQLETNEIVIELPAELLDAAGHGSAETPVPAEDPAPDAEPHAAPGPNWAEDAGRIIAEAVEAERLHTAEIALVAEESAADDAVDDADAADDADADDAADDDLEGDGEPVSEDADVVAAEAGVVEQASGAPEKSALVDEPAQEDDAAEGVDATASAEPTPAAEPALVAEPESAAAQESA